MASNSRGIPALPPALMRPTTQAQADDQAEGEEAVGPADESRGDQRPSSAAGASASKARRRRPVAPAEKTNKRGLHLTDTVWDRLQYEAIRRKTTVSAIAGDVLERHLPRYRVEREG